MASLSRRREASDMRRSVSCSTAISKFAEFMTLGTEDLADRIQTGGTNLFLAVFTKWGQF